MAVVVEFVKEYAPWIYGACALIALWYLRVAVLARRERRYSVFSLEREAALNKTYNAWSAAFALLIVMGLVYFLSTVVSDAVRPLVLADETPTPAAIAARPSPTPTLPASDISPTVEPTNPPATARPQPTRTPPPTVVHPTATPAPAAAPVSGPRCRDPRAIITSPGVNATVSGIVPIFGTATHDKFKYYKLEYGIGSEPGVWSYFAGGEHPVQGGQLGSLNAGALAPGTYSIRIVVVDVTGNFPDPCQTTVIIK